MFAVGGGSSTMAEATLLRSSVAAMFTGGSAFAAEAVGAGVVGRGAAAGAEAGADVAGVDMVSSGANCSTVSDVAGASVAVGSTLGQATREFILSARRTGRWVFDLAVTVGWRFVASRVLFIVDLWVLRWLVFTGAVLF